MVVLSTPSENEAVERLVFGGKAYWLSWLIAKGYTVPPCFFVSAIDNSLIEQTIAELRHSAEFSKQINEFATGDNQFEVALRSSAIGEDSSEKSYAGHFKSFVERVTYEQLLKRMSSIFSGGMQLEDSYPQKIGVVVQKKINAKFSGVAFSSHPITAMKTHMVVSIIAGMGEKLVSGKIAGEDIEITCEDSNYRLPDYKSDIQEDDLLELCRITKEIENTLNIPVDIEWCVDSVSNQLYILQCRPVTGIFPNRTGVIPINLEYESQVPYQVKTNDKVRIRLLAQRNSIDISNAYLVANTNTSVVDDNELAKIQPEDRCKGYSVVLLFPKTISGNIIRHFAESEVSRQSSAYRTCQRYDVRSYQDYGNLKGILQSIQAKCRESCWLSIAIIQEIFEPVYTGIVKKIHDGFIIEIAKGHFVPKGIVPTSQYVLDTNFELAFKSEILQEYYYRIFQGAVSKEILNEVISVNTQTLSKIVNELMPVLSGGDQAVEFGLLKNSADEDILSPYLIDLVEDNSSIELSSQAIAEGVISPGVKSGRASILDAKALGHNSLELHFHNHFESVNTIDEAVIFISETPDIALLEVLKHHNNNKIGFVFKEGSALSHFSIVLREKGIPAIVINQGLNIQGGEEIRIDASSQNLIGMERLHKLSRCVTTYINPDTDGICTSIAYCYYAKAKGIACRPIYFGNLDKETIFVLNWLDVPFPEQVKTAGDFAEMVIVDTHHVSQLPKDISLDKVVEIIDHHPNGDWENFPNAKIQNDEIGAAATIIAERMKDEYILPDRAIAGIMALAIISNTLNFTAPSTSQRDRNALDWLKTFIKIDDELVADMFNARSDVSEMSSQEIILGNLKEFKWGNTKAGISQIEMTDVRSIIERADFIDSVLKVKESLSLDFLLFTGVNILKRTSIICCPDNKCLRIVTEAMGFVTGTLVFEVDRMLLRKTDFIPSLKSYFESKE
jgi:inorganic pyrophosphatase/exopolyphosphatase/phosphohistidine swiveling domain-containing protein